MFKRIFLITIICCSLLSLLLISHRSDSKGIFSRYSIRYFIFLIIYHTCFGIVIILYFNAERTQTWLEQIRHHLSNFSAINFIEKHYNKLLLIILFSHIIEVFIYFPPQKIFTNLPILQRDYALHYYHISSFIETFTEYGKHWAYDPFFAAGYPLGTLFDTEMKFFEIFILSLTKLGVDPAFAYNCLILTLLIIVPVILYLVGKHFGCSKVSILLIMLSGTLLWHSDREIQFFYTYGMVSFGFGIYWGFLCTSLLYRFLTRERMIDFFLFLFSFALSFMVHILMPVLLAVPLSILYILSIKKIRPISHGLIFVSILVALVVNSWWISSVLRFWHYQTPHIYWQSLTISEFIRSLPEMATNIGDNLVILGLWGFYISILKNKRFAFVGIFSIIWFFFLGKLGSNLPLIKLLEPARFLIPARIFAVVGITLGLQDLLNEINFQQINLRRMFPIFVAPILITIQVITPYWFKNDFFVYEQSNIEELRPVVTWINEHTTKKARIAFSDQSPGGIYSGAKLKYYIDREIIGGPFSYAGLKHFYATFTGSIFFDKAIYELTKDEFIYFTDLYNIKWVVSADETASRIIGSFTPIVEKVKEFQGQTTFTIYEVNIQPNYFLQGSGSINTRLNEIEIQNAGSSETILKYHWLETLAVLPEISIEKYEVDGNPIGFIKVINGDIRDFVIYNSYESNPLENQTLFARLGQYLDFFNLSYNK